MDFASRVIAWQRRAGRFDLPWQVLQTPYAVWISEVMLQQTQVATVIPYFQRFMASFPTVSDLAGASEDAVLLHWSGLGYYRRAKHLHQASRLIVSRHEGCLPESLDALMVLPGIGESTAAAIRSLAFKKRAVICDGNVKWVLSRHGGIVLSHPRDVREKAWPLARQRTPEKDVDTYNQGMMDLGAMVCTRTRPMCGVCPVSSDCYAYQHAEPVTFSKPAVRAKKKRIHYQCLILSYGNRYWLEKRDASGIWPGLWSFPLLASLDAWQGRKVLGAVMDACVFQKDWSFDHMLTHQHWTIHPYVCRLSDDCDTKSLLALIPNGQWLSLDAIHDHAIPAVVRKLCSHLG